MEIRMALSILDEAPPELRSNIVLQNGVFIIADVWKGHPDLASFISFCRKRTSGSIPVKFVATDTFRRDYGEQLFHSAPDSDIQKEACDIINAAVARNATDIHLIDKGTYGLVQMRSLGILTEFSKVPGTYMEKLISVLYGTIASSASSPSFSKQRQHDGRISRREFLPSKVHSIRLHTVPIENAETEDPTGTFMTLRLLYDQTDAHGTLESRMTALGYREKDVEKLRLLVERSGLIVIAGPTGSGKSTALKHVFEARSEESSGQSFLSVEDPPEYPIANVKQTLVRTTDSGDDDADARGKAYVNAIAGAMRSDPDMLMIGEIRYPEAAAATIDAAMTSHAVWATIHAFDALGIILRLRSLLTSAHFAEPMDSLCNSKVVAGLIFQRLIPQLCPYCKMPFYDSHNKNEAEEKRQESVLPKHVRKRLENAIPHELWKDIKVRGEGCDHCNHMGLSKQSVVSEVIVTDNELLGHIKDGNWDKAVEYWHSQLDGHTYVEHALEGITSGRFDPYFTEIRLGVPLNYISTYSRGGR
jgi:type II secretory ATPase GspE/PulE/Tfp pilus assembly ATPase PilB-like protein